MKRIIGGLLWALVVMWAGSYVTQFAELPTALSLPFAVAVAMLIVVDPAHRLWAIDDVTLAIEPGPPATEHLLQDAHAHRAMG